MKKLLSLGIALMLVVSAVGCAGAANGSEAKDPDQGNSMLIQTEKIDQLTLSEENQKILEEKRSTMGHYLFKDNGTTCLAVFSGEKNTGGYTIEIVEVSLEGEQLSVSTVETEPGPDDMVTQAITYPTDIVKLADIKDIEDLDIRVEFEGFIPSKDDADRTDGGYFISSTDGITTGEVITVGEIAQFDGQHIHIIAGDLIEVYEYDSDQAEEFYLGETVQLIKGEKTNTLEPFIIKDFSIRHTSMGDMIHAVKGEVTTIDEEHVNIANEDGEIALDIYGEVNVQVGNLVEARYIDRYEDDFSLIAIYRDDARMEMTVRDIVRGDDGAMTIYTSDAGSDNVDYHVSIGGATMELNLSELAVDDTIYVYADKIMESYPAQVIASRIIK